MSCTCKLPAAVGRGELRRRAACGRGSETPASVCSMSAELLEARHDLRDRLANLAGVFASTANRSVLPGCRRAVSRADAGDHLHFASRAFVPARAAVAEAHVVEHRFLRRRLRLFVAGQHRQDDRLLRQAVGVARVERRVQVDEHVELLEQRLAAKFASGFEPYRFPPRQKPEFQLACFRRLPCKPACRGPAWSAA